MFRGITIRFRRKCLPGFWALVQGVSTVHDMRMHSGFSPGLYARTGDNPFAKSEIRRWRGFPAALKTSHFIVALLLATGAIYADERRGFPARNENNKPLEV